MNETLLSFANLLDTYLKTISGLKYKIIRYDELEVAEDDTYYFLISFDTGKFQKITTTTSAFRGTISFAIAKKEKKYADFMDGMTWFSGLINEILSKVFTDEITFQNLVKDIDNDVCGIEFTFSIGKE